MSSSINGLLGSNFKIFFICNKKWFFLPKTIILHIFDCFEDHTTRKKIVTRDVTNIDPLVMFTFGPKSSSRARLVKEREGVSGPISFHFINKGYIYLIPAISNLEVSVDARFVDVADDGHVRHTELRAWAWKQKKQAGQLYAWDFEGFFWNLCCAGEPQVLTWAHNAATPVRQLPVYPRIKTSRDWSACAVSRDA